MEIQALDSKRLENLLQLPCNLALKTKLDQGQCGSVGGCVNFSILDKDTLLGIASLVQQPSHNSSYKNFYFEGICIECDRVDYQLATYLLEQIVCFCAQNQSKLKVSVFVQNYLLMINQDIDKVCKDFSVCLIKK